MNTSHSPASFGLRAFAWKYVSHAPSLFDVAVGDKHVCVSGKCLHATSKRLFPVDRLFAKCVQRAGT